MPSRNDADLGKSDPELEILTVTEPPVDVGLKFWEIWAVKKYEPYTSKFQIKLSVGDEVWIKKEGSGYYHVALYVGNGYVIHVSDVQKTITTGKTLVAHETLDHVAEGHYVGFRKTEGTWAEREEMVQRAKSDVGKVVPYLVTTENCEHQVRAWITGEDIGDFKHKITGSSQIVDYLVVALIGGIICAVIGGIVAVYAIAKTVLSGVLGGFVGFTLGAVIAAGIKYVGTCIEGPNVTPIERSMSGTSRNRRLNISDHKL